MLHLKINNEYHIFCYRTREKLKALLGPMTPIYDCSVRSYTALDILDIIIGGVPNEKLCTKKPTCVRTTASFVIDLNAVQLSDIKADDNGSWVTSNPRRTYEIEMHEGHVVVAVPVQVSSSSNCYTLCRQYGTHKGTSDFRRILAFVIDASGKTMSKAFLYYYFKSGIESEVKIIPHGNAHNCKPYFRTQPSTLKDIKESCSSKSVAKVYDDVFEKSGGLDGSVSISAEPRNKMQIYNARKCLPAADSCKDDLYDLMELLKRHQSDPAHGFLQEITLTSSPCAVLATQQQLDNIVTYCCQPNNFSVLGVDATFNLGDFYVTMTTYRNFTLCNPRTSLAPVFIGPVFLHMERRAHDYHTFFSSLLRLKPQLASLQAYGTDGEQALLNALESCFPHSIGLRCFLHMQGNIEDKLKGSSAAVKKSIIHDIFGYQSGDVYNKGIVDAESDEEFDEQVGMLSEKWEQLCPGFNNWFKKKHATTFKKSMIASIRTKALLGSPPIKFTNNPNESINSTVKKWVQFKKSTWPGFVEKLQQLVDTQLKEAGKAIYNSGDYILAPPYLHFAVDQMKWHQMEPTQRKAYLKSLAKNSSACVNNPSSSCVHGSAALSSLDELEGASSSCRPPSSVVLSMSATDVMLPSLSTAAVASMFQKATTLIAEGHVVPAPGNDNAFIVASVSSQRPHFVRRGKGDKVLCDDQCAMWRGSKICAHTIAVAEKFNCLSNFVGSVMKSSKQTNLTRVMTTQQERRKSGTKSTTPKRKGSSNRHKVPVNSCVNITEQKGTEQESPSLLSDKTSTTSSVKGVGSCR